MITALILIGGWFLICAFAVLLVRGGSDIETPKPVPTNAQITWMTAAAKVAARRHA
jgi:hypothetical protein